MHTTRDVVLSVLAYRCNRGLSALTASRRLAELRLNPLDLVLLIDEVAEFEAVDIPLDGIEKLATVGQLTNFCVRAVHARRTKQGQRRVS